MAASLVNVTAFGAQDVTLTDEAGRDVATVIVKATYVIDAHGRASATEDPSPIRLADELHRPDEPWSSARYPSDVCWAKVGTDVIVVGDAVSPKPSRSVDVAISVGERTVPLRVHGDRVFYRSGAEMAIGKAAPFEVKPIVYERAYGGTSADGHAIENRNPSGVGVARRTADLDGTPAPQIEHPARPHTTSSDKHAPVGYGSIMSFWSPRREWGGSFDAKWQAERMPVFPVDFDLRFNNVAHPSLMFERHLSPGDRVTIVGMSLAPLHLELPRLPVRVRARFDQSGPRTVPPPIDTVLIEPGRRRVEVTGRATFLVGRGKDVLRELRVELDDD